MAKQTRIILKLFVCSLAIFLSLETAFAFELSNTDQGSGNTVLSTGTTISDNYFSFGNVVNINGQIQGDLITAGNQLEINGDVGNNIFAAGNTVTIKGKIHRDVFVAGANIIIEKDAVIDGDLSVAASSLVVNGEVKGMLRAGVGTLNINGKIGKEINANVETFNINKDAIVIGDITYTSSKQANINNNAQIAGKVELKDIPTQTEKNPFREKMLSSFISLLSALLIGAILVSLLPKKMKDLTDLIRLKFWASFGAGFLVFFAIPMAALILLLILIGIPLALILMAIYFVMIYLSKIIIGLCIGRLVTRDAWAPIWSMTIGVLIYSVLSIIPVVGTLTVLVSIILGFGSIGLLIAGKK